ncbi:Eukaryotic translation initiation factor 4E-binding protein Mextli [Frankliniella fusca]|uniref:Eukaryotic translation initiation factor 4E-binding protein Mextli n=1 Tax=Frankliniella fusca TaxID=407009 RepID=A0AAE1I0J6_9NEOP|nr:Eukaryotic translation initiation factor 4E-binding protein Mextli [Frankliniella fusca]
MGIKGRRVHMIEEMSETIISFQRVNPGAKERLVQITGPTEEKIIHARQLMEDTIRRNASPVRPEQPEGLRDHRETLGGSSSSLNSSASDDSARVSQGGVRRSTLLHSFSTNDASLGEYKYTVAVGGCVLKITGANHDIVRAAKLVLDEYFAGQDLGYFDSYEEELPSPTGNAANKTASSTPPTSLSSTVDNVSSSSSQTCLVAPAGTNLPSAVPVSVVETIGSNSFNPHSTSTIAASSSVESYSSESEETVRSAAPSGLECVKRKQYSVEELLSFAASPVSRDIPFDWHRIAKEFPSIVKKTDPFEPSQHVRPQDTVCSSVISATESESPDPE